MNRSWSLEGNHKQKYVPSIWKACSAFEDLKERQLADALRAKVRGIHGEMQEAEGSQVVHSVAGFVKDFGLFLKGADMTKSAFFTASSSEKLWGKRGCGETCHKGPRETGRGRDVAVKMGGVQ